jgi:hypothetical protein
MIIVEANSLFDKRIMEFRYSEMTVLTETTKLKLNSNPRTRDQMQEIQNHRR